MHLHCSFHTFLIWAIHGAFRIQFWFCASPVCSPYLSGRLPRGQPWPSIWKMFSMEAFSSVLKYPLRSHVIIQTHATAASISLLVLLFENLLWKGHATLCLKQSTLLLNLAYLVKKTKTQPNNQPTPDFDVLSWNFYLKWNLSRIKDAYFFFKKFFLPCQKKKRFVQQFTSYSFLILTTSQNPAVNSHQPH